VTLPENLGHALANPDSVLLKASHFARAAFTAEFLLLCTAEVVLAARFPRTLASYFGLFLTGGSGGC
jgi:hypothetical protein